MVQNNLPKINKHLLLLLCMLWLSLNGYSQANNWTFEGYAPAFRHINAAQILDNGRIVGVGGWQSNDSITSFYTSDDSAHNWFSRMDIVNAMINDLHFPTPTIGYAVGDGGRMYKTTDAGTTWTPLFLTGNIAKRTYKGVHFLDAQIGIAVGGNKSNDSIQTILRTTNGGATWNIISDNLGSMLQDVYFVNTTLGFAVGDKGKILKTTDGGLSWSVTALAGNLMGRELHSVDFIDTQTGVIVGGFPKNDSIQTILRTTNGGQSWNIVTDAVASMLKTVHFISATQGYIAGNDGVIKYSNDQGATWNALNIAGNNQYDIYDINFLNIGYGVAVGESGKTLLYKDVANMAASATIITPITILNANSVQVDGKVTTNGNSTSVEFEYGTTNTFGTTIPMSPSSVNGTQVPVSVNVTGLLPNTVYYGRIKTTNAIGIGYSSTLSFYTSVSGIPNFDFEDWNSFTYDILQDWVNAGVVQKVSSYNGSFAARLTTSVNQTPGVVAYANVGSSSSNIQPLPYNGGRPDTLAFFAKYDIEANDSAFVKITFKAGAQVIADQNYKIGGSSNGNFLPIKIPINYNSAATPDSLILLMLNTNYFSTGNASVISQLTLDDIHFIGASTQLPNSDMENWNSTGRNQAVSWYSQDDLNYSPGDSTMVMRTTDAYTGNYAILIRTNPAYNQFASLNTSLGQPKPSFPVQLRHTHLKGYFKFQQDANDTFFIYVNMYYQGNLVGLGNYRATSSVNTYTNFNVLIQYLNGSTPDSANIFMSVRKMGQNATPGNSWAIIDNLTFEGVSNVGIETPEKETSVIFFPNPVNDILYLNFTDIAGFNAEKLTFTIYDLTGREVYTQEVDASPNIQLGVKELLPQIYIIKITTKEKQVISRFIKSK